MPPDPGSDPILSDLNPEQREAVLHEKGPLLIVAGAGSGKTRVITRRIAHLIRKGAAADSILAITFTNKAAGEMKERTESLCGISSPWVSTFHSFGARILRRHIGALESYDSTFSIYDADDSRAVLAEVIESLDAGGIWKPRAAQEAVSRAKNSAESTAAPGAFAGSRFRRLGEIVDAYSETLRERNAVDFDDLLLLTLRLLEEFPAIRERYQQQFQHVLVDEFQDTNVIQYRIGKVLTAEHRNFCITGDPDQSIYAWRGAHISNILDFESDYPDARVVKLEENYRSTGNILRVANSLIAHNRSRIPKSLWSSLGDGEPVSLRRHIDESSEARSVARTIGDSIADGVPPNEIAVFYRMSSLSRPIEQELIYAGIPYQVIGGVQFFLRREVKDVIAYLRILDNPRDLESLKRIINVPARGIGAATLQKLRASAKAAGRSVLDEILDGDRAGLGKKAALAIRSFADTYRDIESLGRLGVQELTRGVIDLTDYKAFLEATYGPEAAEKVENLAQLVNAAAEFDREEEGRTLGQFLERVGLLSDVDRWERRDDKVSLMTLHAAKGLEFRVVLVIGIEDGILPLTHPGDEIADRVKDEEEERRLFYVGITRARERLFLSHAATRMRFGTSRRAVRSAFVDEIGDSAEGEEMDGEVAGRPGRGGSRRATIEEDLSEGWGDPGDWEVEEYSEGTRVYHETYGAGDVVRVTGVGLRQRITVAFDEGEEKQFALGFAKLRRIRRDGT